MTQYTMMLIGEAWGAEEEAARQPFIGPSGRVLNGILSQVGIPRAEVFLTNVFNLRPRPTNDIKNLCGPRAEGIPGMPYLTSGKYVRAEYAPELDRLYAEIEAVRPNVIVALGATPAWALLGTSGIRNIRGAPALSSKLGVKVLPTYHPAAVMRDWRLRPIVIADLLKAKREAEYPEIIRPEREVWLEPSIADLWEFKELYLDEAHIVSTDIETKGRIITCIGFAPSPSHCLVIPFFDPTKPGCNYWPTFAEEKEAWNFVRLICKEKRHTGQNFSYDMNFLWTEMGIPVPKVADDTMLLHHALQPELEKGLGFLGSIYTNEASWKFMRKGSSTLKKED